MVYSVSGLNVGIYFEFVVNASNTEIVELTMMATDNAFSSHLLVGPPSGISSLPIANGSFQLEAPGGSCNGSRGNNTFKGTFRSTTNADGEWKDTNTGPPGYTYCGSTSFNWTAQKAGASVPGTGLSQPGIAIAQTNPAAGGTISIGRCGTPTTSCTTALTVVLDVVPAARVTSPFIAIDLLRADGQRCASMLTTRSSPTGPIVDSLLPNVRAVYTVDFFSFDKPTGSETPTCQPPFTTTRMRAHLHEASPNNPAVLDKTFDIVFNWTS